MVFVFGLFLGLMSWLVLLLDIFFGCGWLFGCLFAGFLGFALVLFGLFCWVVFDFGF